MSGYDDLRDVDEDGWYVIRSGLDPRVWLPVSFGFGDVSSMTMPGGLRATKDYVEVAARADGDGRWVRINPDVWHYDQARDTETGTP